MYLDAVRIWVFSRPGVVTRGCVDGVSHFVGKPRIRTHALDF